MNQRGDGVGKQLIEELAVVLAEVAEQMIVHPHATTDPHVRQIAFAQTVQLPRAADPFNRSQHPQRHQNFGIDRIPTRLPFDRSNLGVQRTQIERVNIRPHRPRPMITGEQLIQRPRPPLHLPPLSPLHPHPTNRLFLCCTHTPAYSAPTSNPPGQKNHSLGESCDTQAISRIAARNVSISASVPTVIRNPSSGCSFSPANFMYRTRILRCLSCSYSEW